VKIGARIGRRGSGKETARRYWQPQTAAEATRAAEECKTVRARQVDGGNASNQPLTPTLPRALSHGVIGLGAVSRSVTDGGPRPRQSVVCGEQWTSSED